MKQGMYRAMCFISKIPQFLFRGWAYFIIGLWNFCFTLFVVSNVVAGIASLFD